MFRFRGAFESGILMRTVRKDRTIQVNEVTFPVPPSCEPGQEVRALVDLEKSRVFLIFLNGKKHRLFPQKVYPGNRV